MNLIVAVDNEWNIGYKGDLLEKISEDLKFFKSMTINKTVVMGRNTFESLPGKKPLKNRRNIVLSSNKDLSIDGVEICSSLEELFGLISETDSNDVFIIGGEQVYKLLLPYCHLAYVTKIFNTYTADKKMENIDLLSNWEIVKKSDLHNKDCNLRFQFLTYQNKSIKLN